MFLLDLINLEELQSNIYENENIRYNLFNLNIYYINNN